MKRCNWTAALLLCASLVCGVIIAYAAGTATVTPGKRFEAGGDKTRKAVLTITWVDNAGTTKTINPVDYGIDMWVLYSCTGNPGSHALTDNFDMYLYDKNNVDLMGGAMVNSDNSTSTDYYPTKGFPVIDGNMTFTLSGNSQASGNGTLTCTFFEN
jgi:hypothetical protein